MNRKQPYHAPRILQTATAVLEGDLLFGSIVDQVFPVETIGQEQASMYDYWDDSETFNHTWGE